jgi:hypothetical protein
VDGLDEAAELTECGGQTIRGRRIGKTLHDDIRRPSDLLATRQGERAGPIVR